METIKKILYRVIFIILFPLCMISMVLGFIFLVLSFIFDMLFFFIKGKSNLTSYYMDNIYDSLTFGWYYRLFEYLND